MPEVSQLLSKQINKAVAPSLNQSLAEFASVNAKLRPDTVDDGSTTMFYVNKPVDTWEGSSARPSGYNEDQEKAVPVKMRNIAAEINLGTVEMTNDVIDEDAQVISRLKVGMQRHLKYRFYRTALATANYAITATSADNGYWGAIQKAIAAVKTYGLADETSILCPDVAMATLQRFGAQVFYSPEIQGKVFENRLGKIGTTDFLTTNLNAYAGTATLPSTVAAAAADGDTYIAVAATTALIPAGTMFTIANVFALDIDGNQIIENGSPVLASFTTPIDIPIGSTALPLGKAIFSAGTANNATWQGQTFSNGGVSIGGGIATVSALPAANAAITQINAGKTAIIVYGDRAVAAVTATPARTSAVDENVNTDFGVGIRTTVQWNPDKGKTNFRMETIAGFSGIYSQAAVAVLL